TTRPRPVGRDRRCAGAARGTPRRSPPLAPPRAGSVRSPRAEVVGKGAQLLVAVARDQEIVLEAQPAAAFPVDAGLDREHHPLPYLAAARLVRVRRLVGARADAVADGVRGLPGITAGRDAGADESVELGQRRAVAGVVDGGAED